MDRVLNAAMCPCCQRCPVFPLVRHRGLAGAHGHGGCQGHGGRAGMQASFAARQYSSAGPPCPPGGGQLPLLPSQGGVPLQPFPCSFNWCTPVESIVQLPLPLPRPLAPPPAPNAGLQVPMVVSVATQPPALLLLVSAVALPLRDGKGRDCLTAGRKHNRPADPAAAAACGDAPLPSAPSPPPMPQLWPSAPCRSQHQV